MKTKKITSAPEGRNEKGIVAFNIDFNDYSVLIDSLNSRFRSILSLMDESLRKYDFQQFDWYSSQLRDVKKLIVRLRSHLDDFPLPF